MMTTLRVSVYGDSHEEIVEKAEREICTFLEIDTEELDKKVNYELQVERDDAFDAEFDYKCEVIARIK